MSAFPTLPPIGTEDDTSNSSKLADMRRAMAEADDDAQRSRLGEDAGNTPHDGDNLLPRDNTALPPALRGAIIAEQDANNARTRANRRAEAIASGSSPLTDRGAAKDTSGDAIMTRSQYQCPNCGRVRDYQVRYAGSTVPCVCGTNVRVPFPNEMVGMVPGPATTGEVQAAAEADQVGPVEDGDAAPAAKAGTDSGAGA